MITSRGSVGHGTDAGGPCQLNRTPTGADEAGAMFSQTHRKADSMFVSHALGARVLRRGVQAVVSLILLAGVTAGAVGAAHAATPPPIASRSVATTVTI